MAVTIIDIAKATGKTYQTVSRALNDNPRISLKTRQLVHAAAEKLGYLPNRAAGQLRRGRSNTIGVLVPSPISYFYAELVAELHQSIRMKGYSPVFAFWTALPERKAAMESILSWNVEGIITIEPELIPETCRIPVVGYRNIDPRFDSLTVDWETCMNELMDYLRKLGHTDVAYIGHEDLKSDYMLAYAEKHSMRFRIFENSVTKGLQTFSGSAEIFDSMIRKCGRKNLPTAIVTLNDMAATSVIRRMHELGIRCPEDMSVVGCDDLQHSARMIPSLTTIRTGSFLETGRLLTDMIVERILKPDLPIRRKVIPGTLVVRESTGSPEKNQPTKGEIK